MSEITESTDQMPEGMDPQMIADELMGDKMMEQDIFYCIAHEEGQELAEVVFSTDSIEMAETLRDTSGLTGDLSGIVRFNPKEVMMRTMQLAMAADQMEDGKIVEDDEEPEKTSLIVLP